jgi:hypothetical protein
MPKFSPGWSGRVAVREAKASDQIRAVAFAGDPVPPVMFSGLMVMKASHRPALRMWRASGPSATAHPRACRVWRAVAGASCRGRWVRNHGRGSLARRAGTRRQSCRQQEGPGGGPTPRQQSPPTGQSQWPGGYRGSPVFPPASGPGTIRTSRRRPPGGAAARRWAIAGTAELSVSKSADLGGAEFAVRECALGMELCEESQFCRHGPSAPHVAKHCAMARAGLGPCWFRHPPRR